MTRKTPDIVVCSGDQLMRRRAAVLLALFALALGALVTWAQEGAATGDRRRSRHRCPRCARTRTTPRPWTHSPTRHSSTRYGRTFHGSSPPGDRRFSLLIWATRLRRGVDATLEQALRASPLAALAYWDSVSTRTSGRTCADPTCRRWSCTGPGDANTPSTQPDGARPPWCPRRNIKEYDNAAHGLYMTHANRLNANLLPFIKS